MTVEEALRDGYYEITDAGRWSLENGHLKSMDLSKVRMMEMCCTDWFSQTTKGSAKLHGDIAQLDGAVRQPPRNPFTRRGADA